MKYRSNSTHHERISTQQFSSSKILTKKNQIIKYPSISYFFPSHSRSLQTHKELGITQRKPRSEARNSAADICICCGLCRSIGGIYDCFSFIEQRQSFYHFSSPPFFTIPAPSLHLRLVHGIGPIIDNAPRKLFTPN